MQMRSFSLLMVLTLGTVSFGSENLIRVIVPAGKSVEVSVKIYSGWENSCSLSEVGGETLIDCNNQNGIPAKTVKIAAAADDRVFLVSAHHKQGPSNKDLPWLGSPFKLHHKSEDGKLSIFGAEDGGDASYADVVVRIKFSP
jgi:hypothetical protein